MGKNINSYMKDIMNTNTVQKALYEETRKLVGKWEPTGLLEGLSNETEQRSMAVLLENQANQLVVESSRVGGDGTEEWSGVALPLVRRIFGEVAAKEFVSVQPMNLPSGLVFYLDFKYGSGNQPGFKFEHSVFGGDSASDGTAGKFGTTAGVNGGLYGSGRFGYSINDFTSSSLTATIASASYSDVDFDTTISASVARHEIKKVTVTLGPDIDKEGVTAFRPLSSSVELPYYPVHTSVAANGANYDISFYVSASSDGASAAPITTGGWSVQFAKQPIAADRGDFEDTSYSGSYSYLDIPEVDIELQSEPIVAKTRKLKAVWTPELTQDLNAYHAIDAEAELTSMLSEYISMEIDLEILEMLVNNASTTEFWSAKIGYTYDSATNSFIDGATNGQAYTQNRWFKTLVTKIQKVSNKIHQKTLRGGANFIVCSPDVATILESIPGYMADTDGNKAQFAMGVEKAASFNNRFQVYKNPYMTSNVILMGYKGPSFLESGAAYAPYIPLIMTPVVYDKDNFTPRKGVMTRYAKKMFRPEFYGRVVIGNLDQV